MKSPSGDATATVEPARTGRPRVTSRAELERIGFELFARQGFDDTTVDDIAAAAGIGRLNGPAVTADTAPPTPSYASPPNDGRPVGRRGPAPQRDTVRNRCSRKETTVGHVGVTGRAGMLCPLRVVSS